MYQLSGFTDAPKQTISFALEDGSLVDFAFEFRDRQRGWFFDVTYGDFVLKGQRMTSHPNALRAFKNLLPFGLAIVALTPYEPQEITALTDGTVLFYMVEGDELATLDARIDA